MCGIAGILDTTGQAAPRSVLANMTAALAHRGPDGEGLYLDGPLGLGHRRLSILDLSSAGRQPMADRTGNCVLTYNGEIYNYQELRDQLTQLGYRFYSQTDTEVLLNAYHAWGEDCLPRLNGMFAFALWDRQHRRLLVARDRFGIKPLYYWMQSGVFLFASEIKAFLKHPRFSVGVCPEALSEYFTFQNVFTDRTLFQGVHLLPAGCSATIDADGRFDQRRWWDFDFAEQPGEGTLDEAALQLHERFERAVTRQLVSDVPVGAYLSGGIDSGSITGVAAHHLGRLCTFTGGFDLSSASGLELGFDERAASEIMANLFKTEHYEVVLHAGDMEHVLPDLIWHLEDLRVGQCYPNFYVARLASKFVKVVLSGSGGDELFGGYPWRYYRSMNETDPLAYYQSYYKYWQRLVPDPERVRCFQPRIFRSMQHHAPEEVFRSVFSGWKLPLDSIEHRINASLYFELKTFLHGLFVVEDKLSMAHGLESRVPFLDNDLVEFALHLSPRLKLRDLAQSTHIDENQIGKRRLYQTQASADGKVVLRQAMRSIIPDRILERAKQGFSAPDASWFRGESINYVNRVLRSPHARIHEFLRPEYVAHILDEHTSGRVNHRLMIWSMLSFEWWLKRFVA